MYRTLPSQKLDRGKAVKYKPRTGEPLSKEGLTLWRCGCRYGLRVHSHFFGGLRLLEEIIARLRKIINSFCGFCGDHSNTEPSKRVLLRFVINIWRNLCVCEQHIRSQHLSVHWLTFLNGIRYNSFWSCGLCEIKYAEIIALTFSKEFK